MLIINIECRIFEQGFILILPLLRKEEKLLLDVKHLMVFYENALALNDFSLQVDAGEIVAVIGSNSAGKTTLMNAISGLILDIQVKEKRKGGERITLLGEVWFNREDLSRMTPGSAG